MNHDFEKIRQAIPDWNRLQNAKTASSSFIIIGVLINLFNLITNWQHPFRLIPIIVMAVATVMVIYGIIKAGEMKSIKIQVERNHGLKIAGMIKAVKNEINIISTELTPNSFKFNVSKPVFHGKTRTNHWKGRFYDPYLAMTCLETNEFYVLDLQTFQLEDSPEEFLGMTGATIYIGDQKHDGYISSQSLANLRRWEKKQDSG